MRGAGDFWTKGEKKTQKSKLVSILKYLYWIIQHTKYTLSNIA
jgi:hypothetical protein